jgi:AraC family transcriptional regulator of adaptative response/methylated-DNA-[protein]-cysteine methyltransferase
MFKRVIGVTPGAYAAQCRQDRAQAALGTHATVTEAAYEAGFNSSGRFYESAGAMLGMTPTAWKKGGSGETMWHAIGQSNFGAVLVAATAKGICSIMIHDDARRLVSELKSRFPKANHVAPAPEFAKSVEAVVRLVDDPRRSVVLPLDIRGTAFQRRVWEELRKVPAGSTITYAELAKRVGNERAVRAVGTACGANQLAVAIPCHRAVGTDGEMHGYRWGVERKKKLLERERE